MTGMDDLVTWMRAQLDRQEAALIAYRDHRASKGQCVNVLGDDPADYDKWDSCALHIQTADATEYSDNAYGLAEIDAKRRILDWCTEVIGERDMSRYGQHGALADDPDALAVTLAVETLRLLALPMAGRDGYREEWRPR